MLALTPVLERQVYWEFARAETASPRFSGAYSDLAAAGLSRALAQGDSESLTHLDWILVERVVMQARGGVLGPLIARGTQWYQGSLPIRALQSVRLMTYPPFVAYAPSRTLGEFVERMDRNEPIRGDEAFSDNYHALRAGFQISKMRGRPIVVSAVAEGPYVEAEGLTRMSIILSKTMNRELDVNQLSVILGVCRDLPPPFFSS